jgi:AmmeMemoRadiSam system protein B
MELKKPLPKLRNDISVNFFVKDGQEIVQFDDPEGIADSPVAMSVQMYYILRTLDGRLTGEQFKSVFEKEIGKDNIIIGILLENIETMLNSNYLETEHYLAKKEKIVNDYLALPSRPPVCAGNTYPYEEEDLSNMLDDFFATVDKKDIKPGAKSIIVPHIDFQIGKEVHRTYAAAYHSLRDTDADLFVIFGTSHYAYSNYFMLSEKNYSSPLGVIETDKEVLDKLKKEYPKLTIDEMAHRNEHSIELQAVLLQHYFKNRKIKILPVLVGSFFEFMDSGDSPAQVVSEFMGALNKVLKDNNIKAAFISSVDFAHIGKKFGDDFDAREKLDELSSIDNSLIQSLLKSDNTGFFEKIRKDEDKWNVCGTAPMYTMLSNQNGLKGELLQYGQWYEELTKSAVSFASIAYY